jgi:hypothetical protein
MITGFQLDADEVGRIMAWQEEQDRILVRLGKDLNEVGASGGRFTYSFTPTSLGVVVTVEDHLTNNKVDVTDYESW